MITRRYIALLGVMMIGLFSAPVKSAELAGSFTFDALMSEDPIALSDYDGKVLLVVNTASKCGFTGQYEGLEALYQQYKEQGLVIIGVPSNDFGAQEPGTHEDIAEFCKLNFGVSFPMTAKYAVTGDNAHPFYRWARDVKGFSGAPKWNFHKYLVGRDGKLIDYFHSTTSPDASSLVNAVEEALSQS